MGLDVSIHKGTVHPKYLESMANGESMGCGLMYDGAEIVNCTETLYYQRKIYKSRDVLAAALNDESESEYHLLTPQRLSDLLDHTNEEIRRLESSPGDVYYDELQPLRELAECVVKMQHDDGDELYFAIWG